MHRLRRRWEGAPGVPQSHLARKRQLLQALLLARRLSNLEPRRPQPLARPPRMVSPSAPRRLQEDRGCLLAALVRQQQQRRPHQASPSAHRRLLRRQYLGASPSAPSLRSRALHPVGFRLGQTPLPRLPRTRLLDRRADGWHGHVAKVSAWGQAGSTLPWRGLLPAGWP